MVALLATELLVIPPIILNMSARYMSCLIPGLGLEIRGLVTPSLNRSLIGPGSPCLGVDLGHSEAGLVIHIA